MSPLEPPDIDSRRYEELLQEMVGSSPALAAIRERLQERVSCLAEEQERIRRALAELDAMEQTAAQQRQ